MSATGMFRGAEDSNFQAQARQAWPKLRGRAQLSWVPKVRPGDVRMSSGALSRGSLAQTPDQLDRLGFGGLLQFG